MSATQITPSRLVIALLAAGAIGGAGTTALLATTPAHAQSQAQAPVNTVAPPNFAQITRQYGPAVVNISITGSTKVSDEDDPFAQFFGQFPHQAGVDDDSSVVRHDDSAFCPR